MQMNFEARCRCLYAKAVYQIKKFLSMYKINVWVNIWYICDDLNVITGSGSNKSCMIFAQS